MVVMEWSPRMMIRSQVKLREVRLVKLMVRMMRMMDPPPPCKGSEAWLVLFHKFTLHV